MVKQTLHASERRSYLLQQVQSKGKHCNVFEKCPLFAKNRFYITLDVCGGKLNFPHTTIRYRRSVYSLYAYTLQAGKERENYNRINRRFTE